MIAPLAHYGFHVCAANYANLSQLELSVLDMMLDVFRPATRLYKYLRFYRDAWELEHQAMASIFDDEPRNALAEQTSSR